jgi:beta-glucanase (GH16 family)
MAKPGGGVWQCSFDDEFSGTTLNGQNWVAQQTVNSGFTTGAGSAVACYVNRPNNVSEAGGHLNLTVRKEAQPFSCPSPVGSFATQYTAGMVSTYRLFTQSYGLFEVSAKLPAVTVRGLQETLWLWPANDIKYGAWPRSGEIDFAEFYSQYPTLDVPYIHYNAAKPDPNVTSYNCTIADESQFHTYGVQWTSSSITVLYDGKTCLVDRWMPAAPLVSPAPFNQPFLIALTQALGVSTNSFVPGTTPLPATTQIDWVRVWK